MILFRSLLFLDEIQECPEARTAFKFLAQDESIDLIASASLLGLSYREVTSIPAGYERQMEMHGLDFEEYLWAIGIDAGDNRVGSFCHIPFAGQQDQAFCLIPFG